ncbi:MAG: methyltransferase domain-containing protein [Planctomycetota bacterium]
MSHTPHQTVSPRTAAKHDNGGRPAPPRRARPAAPRSRTLGPVPDLERHLPGEWWKSLFNAVYLKTDGDVVEDLRITALEVDALLHATGGKEDDAILDLCCGQGRHCLELARRGFRHVTGIDRSRYLVRLARRRAQQAGLSVVFREGDARRFRVPEGSFDAVTILGNSFGYFEREEDDRAVVESVKRALRSEGILVLDLTDGEWMAEHFERRSWEWIDQNHFVCRERSLAEDRQRLVSREVVVHAEKGVITDQFYAERLYSRGQITALLQEVGFRDIVYHDALVPDSDRGQDLGMMARRNFLTARAPRRIVPGRPGLGATRKITIILGDPRLPDSVKLGGVFNPEDMETISRLKEALAGLTGYTFTYLDNHPGLLGALLAKRPEFVLNLCDEGFRNDAFMEPHVPALLEMLGIPYSGAGPASLALCYNKSWVSAIAQSMGIDVPLEAYFDPDDQSATIPSVFPALLKPAYGDSSVGITQQAVVHDSEALMAYLARLREELPGRPVLVQEFLTGPEYSVGVIGNTGLGSDVLPILGVDYSGLEEGLPHILGYESKWVPGSSYWTKIRYFEADPSENLRRLLTDAALQLFDRLECRDYARFDFRLDEFGTAKLLEVNPNPGWCWDGKFNMMAGFAGLTYTELLQRVLEAALLRVSTRSSPAVVAAAAPAAVLTV